MTVGTRVKHARKGAGVVVEKWPKLKVIKFSPGTKSYWIARCSDIVSVKLTSGEIHSCRTELLEII